MEIDWTKVEHNFQFYRLLDAVLKEPQKVPSIVRATPEILEETNLIGETVLHWLAVENQVEGIQLLRSLGASIPDLALDDAVIHGHLETIILLLKLGADVTECRLDPLLNRSTCDFSERKKRLIRSYLEQFGYESEGSLRAKP